MAAFPVGMLSNNVTEAHLQTVYYTRKSLDRLLKKFVYRSVFRQETLPKNSGFSIQMHRYNNLSPSLTPSTEGDVGTSLTISSRAVRCSVSHFSSFISVSDLHQATAPDDQVAIAAELLGYRGGYSVDNLHRNIIDDQAAFILRTPVGGAGGTAVLRDVRAVRHVLQGLDVKGEINDTDFRCFMHPYVTYDLVNDPETNGLVDIIKRTDDVKSSPIFKYEDRGKLLSIAGCLIQETTSVFTGTDSGSGNATYRSYFFGKNPLAAVDLAGFGPSEVMDPSKQNFQVITKKYEGSTARDGWDPTGSMAGFAAYKFVTGGTWLDGPDGIGGTFRARAIDFTSSIA
jgi:N4-gp56 family major capsid protein